MWLLVRPKVLYPSRTRVAMFGSKVSDGLHCEYFWMREGWERMDGAEAERCHRFTELGHYDYLQDSVVHVICDAVR